MAENTETNCWKNKGFFEKKYQQARLCKNSSIKQATQYSLKKKKKKEKEKKKTTPLQRLSTFLSFVHGKFSSSHIAYTQCQFYIL